MISDSRHDRLANLLRSAKGLPRRLAHVGEVALEILYWAVTFQLVSRLRRRRYARLIRRSGLFDARFYLAQCGDDAVAKRDPIEHYLVAGAARGLEPSPLFDSRAYVSNHPAAGSREQNPLVHFIRSGGSAGRATFPEVTAPPPAAPISPGEALLLGHPFRVTEREEDGSPPARILVVERYVSPADRGPRATRTLALVNLLRDIGFAVAVAADGPEAEGDLEDALGRRGVDVHRGFSAVLAHLAGEGSRYRWVLLAGAEPSFRYLPAARAYCTRAEVIYDAAGAEVASGLVARGLDAPPDEFERLAMMTRADAACSDVVLVATEAQREALLASGCAARIEVVPDPRPGADARHAQRLLEALLLVAGETRGGALSDEGSSAWTA